MLRGNDGHVSKSSSSHIKIKLNDTARKAFDELKNALVSKEVILVYPNFNKEFQLTTDASSVAIGALLSQDNKPITFISRTLNKAEENYATSEREMLAFIWALGSLRNYLYGSAINLCTQQQ